MNLPQYYKRFDDLIIHNGLGLVAVLACFGIFYRAWIFPISTHALDVHITRYLSLALGFLGSLSASVLLLKNIFIRKHVNDSRYGFPFLVSTLTVLYSYTVLWHLQGEYFKYSKVFILIPICLISATQAAIWDSKASKQVRNEIKGEHTKNWLVPIILMSLFFFVIAVIVSNRIVRFEDVFITFRYAWNLAQGHGINWNVSDPIPAEGYTSFAYVLLSSLFFLTKINPLKGTQFANLVSLLLLGYFMWQLGNDIFEDKPCLRTFLPLLLLATYPATAFHIATGMETLFYSACLAGISSFAVKCKKYNFQNRRNVFLLGIMILLSGLTRPEGVIYGLITLGILYLLNAQRLRRRDNIFAFLLTLVIPGLIYFVWRLTYFESLLPLSFYHKSLTGGPYAHAARSVLFTDFIGMVVLPYIGIILYRIFSRSFPKTTYLLIVPSSILILYYSTVLPVAGLQYRFFFPYLFAVLVASGNDLANLMDFLLSKVGRFLTPILSVLLVAYICLGPFYYEARNNIAFLMNDITYDESSDEYIRIGKALLNIEESEPIGIGEVGKIGMLLKDRTVVDIVGLNDRYLARHPFSTDYLDERGINVLITFSYPRAPHGVYADVYRKVGEAFEEIEAKFICVGNIRGLDVFIRREPLTKLINLIGELRNSDDFDEGICLSSTTARWSPRTYDFNLEQWSFQDLQRLETGKGYQFEVTGEDPILRSPILNLDAKDYFNLFFTVRIPPKVECNTFTLYFMKPDANKESEDRSIYVPFEPSNEVQTIIANTRLHPEWQGTISYLRIDPVCGMNNDRSPLQFEILSISLH
jgi:arabinofuranosyltransferase